MAGATTTLSVLLAILCLAVFTCGQTSGLASTSPSPKIAIEACVGGDTTGNIVLGADGMVDQSAWGDGSGVSTCYANSVKGLGSISAFSYYVKRYSGTTGVLAGAYVIDTTTGNTAVASVSISSLLPKSSDLITVTARFASVVSLNASRTYRLAFCTNLRTGALVRYTMRLTNNNIDSIVSTCESGFLLDCLSDSGDWRNLWSAVDVADANEDAVEVSFEVGHAVSNADDLAHALAHALALGHAFAHALHLPHAFAHSFPLAHAVEHELAHKDADEVALGVAFEVEHELAHKVAHEVAVGVAVKVEHELAHKLAFQDFQDADHIAYTLHLANEIDEDAHDLEHSVALTIQLAITDVIAFDGHQIGDAFADDLPFPIAHTCG